ncbi:hypothetical protein, partial [Caulobacter sp. 17J65-9]|uniref:hypothetical protein n=1 Tax=Caulobacter sp. 17J65-9 TaxID=2709382 RepID=UPI0013CB8BFA
MRRLALGENLDLIGAGPGTAAAPVTLSRHAPGLAPQHEHTAAYACAVLAGGFLELSGGRETWCATGYLVTHEAGERHANHIGPDGALCLNLHVDLPASADPVRLAPDARGLADALAQQGLRGADPLTWDSLAAELEHRLGGWRTPPRDPAPVDAVVAALDA